MTNTQTFDGFFNASRLIRKRKSRRRKDISAFFRGNKEAKKTSFKTKLNNTGGRPLEEVFVKCEYLNSFMSWLKKENRECVITYLCSDSSGLFKIGKTSDMFDRFKSLKTANPTIRIVSKTNRNIEAFLHNRFRNKKITGEWFNLEEQDLNFILQKFQEK